MTSDSSDEDVYSSGDEDWFDDSSNVHEFEETIELIESNPDEIEAQLLDSITEASKIYKLHLELMLFCDSLLHVYSKRF